MKNDLLINKKITIAICLAGFFMFCLLALMNMTTPDQMMPMGVLLLFLCIFCFNYGLILVGLIMIKAIRHYFLRSIVKAVDKKDYFCVGIVALNPVIILAMKSIREVTSVEIILLICMTALVCFYLQKR